ncbi:hypothetical protein SAMN04487944_109147 [Gracilibacillus ureilyticus]|uniref:PH domain-containing protein n=1 Tax=Gracilibacillus ureilyticus TaxID=531814 RepID=A0A1H9RVC8_9BACI|nr:hypothetical protein [Gracilibacillus ureilyticus]SER75869.1 hypothetical protein SAMN04487944_109147 [Gracilibacillus ureilyticus]
MTFYGKSKVVPLSLLMISYIILGNQHHLEYGRLYFVILIIMTLATAIFVNIRLTIEEKIIHYTVVFGKYTIYAREITPDQIKEIKGKRLSWYLIGNTLVMKKGLNYQLQQFKPDTIFEQLEQFAEENGVSVNFSKDYKVLRRRQERLEREKTM